MKNLLFFLSLTFLLQSCIGDDIIMDFVEPTIRINNPLDTIEINTSYQFEYSYFNNIGEETAVSPNWSSSDPTVISIDNDGLATALKTGDATIKVIYENASGFVTEMINVHVGTSNSAGSTEKSGTIQTTSTYLLTGDFTMKNNGNGGIELNFANNYQASTALPGLYVYLTNNPTTTSGALEIKKVDVFQGEHTYNIDNVSVNDYQYVLYFCKPFNVKVGDGEIQ